MFEDKIQQVRKAETISYTGKIENIVGMSIEASGGRAAVGDICQIYNGESGGQVLAEGVGFKNDRMLLMPYSDMSGISSGNFVRNTGRRLSLMMGAFLKGRVINALGPVSYTHLDVYKRQHKRKRIPRSDPDLGKARHSLTVFLGYELL